MHFQQLFYRKYFEGINLHKRFDSDEIKLREENRNNNRINAKNEAFKNATVDQNILNKLSHPISANNLLQTVTVTTTYPGLIMGSGYTHEIQVKGEFKLGFYFDHTTGLPCIPGSSIKGVLRSYFPQFKDKNPVNTPTENDDRKRAKAAFIARELGWDENNLLNVHQLELSVFEGVDILETKSKHAAGKIETTYFNIYNRCCFYNAYISRAATGNKIFDIDTITPHTSGPLKNPTPLNFLKIRPGVTFNIPMQLQEIKFSDSETITINQLKVLFEKIIKFNGLGAKTNVGYGQFQ